MQESLFPWKKITLKEALSLDEKPLTHCLYAIHDRVNWLYIGISRRLITRLYQHLGIATGDGQRLMDPKEALLLLAEQDDEVFADSGDYFGYLDFSYAIFTGVPIRDLGLHLMNHRPESLEWGYYYVPIQSLYSNAAETDLNRLLAEEEKKLILSHKPVFNKQHNKRHNKQNKSNVPAPIWAQIRFIEDPDRIVEKARLLLHSTEWEEIIVGLTLTTGRCVTEVLTTGIFSPMTQYSVLFAAYNEEGEGLLQPFELPTLVEASLVLEVWQSVRKAVRGMHLSAQVTCDLYRSDILLTAQEQLASLMPRDDETDRYTPLLRRIYALIALRYYCPVNKQAA